MKIIIKDQPGKLLVAQLRLLFEQMVAEQPELAPRLRLAASPAAEPFQYTDPDTNNVWAGFALALRLADGAAWNPPPGASFTEAPPVLSGARPGDGSQLYLMLLRGSRHKTAIISGARLADYHAVLTGSLQADIGDPRLWEHDPELGACRYTEQLDDGTVLEFILLDRLAAVGAIASDPRAEDPAPECPFSHLLHPDLAGPDPILLYGHLPPSHVKLAHFQVASSPPPRP